MYYEAFFFDFDGVLADSVEVKTRAFARLFESYGPEVVARVVAHHRYHGGMTRIEKIKQFRSLLEQGIKNNDVINQVDANSHRTDE